MSDTGDDERHRGREAASPYPVSRLAPAFQIEDLAARVKSATAVVNTVTTRRLELIAEQMRALRAQAEAVLADAERDLRLNHARCSFRPKAGQTYHLYRDAQGELFFSMLSPDDWGSRAPDGFEGSFRLEADSSWTPAAEVEARDAQRDELLPLLPQPPR